jgi:hypothetical protein
MDKKLETILERTGIDGESLEWILNFILAADEVLTPIFKTSNKIKFDSHQLAEFARLHSLAQKLNETVTSEEKKGG